MWTQLSSLASGKTGKWNKLADASKSAHYQKIANLPANNLLFIAPAIEMGDMLLRDFAAPYKKQTVVTPDFTLFSQERYYQAHDIVIWTLISMLMSENDEARSRILANLDECFTCGEDEQRIEELTEQIEERSFNVLFDFVSRALMRTIPGKSDFVRGMLFQVQIAERYISYKKLVGTFAASRLGKG